LIAATLCPNLGLQLDADSEKAAWNRAIEIFRFHSKSISSAEKGIVALKWFRRTIAAHTKAAISESISCPHHVSLRKISLRSNS
jgi:hypothetical protein